MSFTLKSFQTVAGIRQFHDFFHLIVGGILSFSPTVSRLAVQARFSAVCWLGDNYRL